jgi:molecular chaperone DnaK (HSP70)
MIKEIIPHPVMWQSVTPDATKNKVALNTNNTVFDAKRLIGRRFDDPKFQDDMKH